MLSNAYSHASERTMLDERSVEYRKKVRICINRNELNDFLKETEFCDFRHPEIQKLSHRICGKIDNDRDKAIALYYWVRDNIIYRLGLWNRKASETLWEMEGTCTNKANLLIALLRANNIPAAYGILRVNGQAYFGSANFMSKFISTASDHIYSLLYLDNKWIVVDASDDSGLSRSVQNIVPQAREVHFDGINDARLNLDPDHILGNKYPIADIEHIFKKKLRRGKGFPLTMANLWLKYLRETKKRFDSADELKESCLHFVKTHHPLYYRPVVIAIMLKDLELKFKAKCNNFFSNKYQVVQKKVFSQNKSCNFNASQREFYE
jgi:hypothetical protein